MSDKDSKDAKATTAMPGDADERMEKLRAEAKLRTPRTPVRKKKDDDSDDNDSVEETDTERGSLTPVQYDDDGYGDVPVQMRD